MKRFLLALALLLLAATVSPVQAQWPQQTVRDMSGRMRSLANYAPTEGIVLFVFWKTCCPNNITMLEELYEVWLAHDHAALPVRVVLVSLDDQRSASRVKPIVSSNGWGWPVIMDKNGDLARQFQVIMPPQWVAFDPTGREVFRSKVTNGLLDSAIYFDRLITETRKTK